MVGAHLLHQIDAARRTAAACHVEARAGSWPAMTNPRASSSFVRACALALTNGGRQLPPSAGGRQLAEPHFKKSVCHGALHLSHAPGATASGGDGDRSRTPALDCVVQGLREPVLDFHSFYPIRETPASRANEKALPEMRTSA